VGDLELEERAALHDRLRPGRVADTGELDHDAVVADLLDDWFLDAELVDTLAEHREREVEIPLGIGRHLLALVELEREVHAALQIETPLERDPRVLDVVHRAVGTALTQGHGAREQKGDRNHHEENDRDYTETNGSKHRRFKLAFRLV